MASEAVSDDVERALTQMAGIIGPDVALFAPPEERRLDPLSVGIALAGVLVMSFLKGFQAQASQDLEGAGRWTARWLTERIQTGFRHLKALSEKVPGDVRELAEQARPTAVALTPSELSAYEHAVSVYLEKELIEEWALPPAKAKAVLERARSVAIPLALGNAS
jgi:hypothetical protein